MTTTARNVSVGLFVLVALSGLGWMIVQFGGSPRALADTYPVQMTFPTAGPINEGAEVRVSGVVVGYVNDIQPERDFLGGVRVTADVKRRYKIPARCRAVIRPFSLGLAKSSIEVEVLPGAGDQTLPQDGSAVVPGVVLSGLQGVLPEGDLQSIRRLTDSLARAADALAGLMEPRPASAVDAAATQPELMPNLTTVVQRLDTTLKGINELIETRSGDVSQMILNLRDASADARQITETLKEFSTKAVAVADSAQATFKTADATLKTANAQLERVATALVDNSTQLAAALDTLNKSLNQVAAGRGALGKLVNDPALYDNLVIATDRLRETIISLQALVSKWEAEGVAIKLK